MKKFIFILILGLFTLSNFVFAQNESNLTIITSSLSSGQTNQNYQTSVSAQGGKDNYSWEVSSGILPPGIKLFNAVCTTSPCQTPATLSGIPTQPGRYDFLLTVTSGAEQVSQRFSVLISPPGVSLVLNSPNGSEEWFKGGTYNITWDSTNVSKVYLELRKGGRLVKGLTRGFVANQGFYRWVVPTYLSPGDDYKIRIRVMEGSAVAKKSSKIRLAMNYLLDFFNVTRASRNIFYDESDQVFTIGVGQLDISPTPPLRPSVSATPVPRVTLYPPKISCIPRPYCLDNEPYCLMPEPMEGWCDPSIEYPAPVELDQNGSANVGQSILRFLLGN